MPWKSTAQQAWGHTPAGIRALGGQAAVHEWDEATKRKPGGFARLPHRAGDPPGANLTMRPAVAPMSGIMPARNALGTTIRSGSTMASRPFMKPVRPSPLKMVKPKGPGMMGKAPTPPGTRSMDRKAPGMMFGSFGGGMMPPTNMFTGQMWPRQTQMGGF